MNLGRMNPSLEFLLVTMVHRQRDFADRPTVSKSSRVNNMNGLASAFALCVASQNMAALSPARLVWALKTEPPLQEAATPTRE